MGVAALLELESLDRSLLVDASELWASWTDDWDLLRVVGSVGELRPWLQQADPAEADEVLWHLARLGSPMGGDLRSASAVLAWCLLPGACSLARQLRTASSEIDELVAGRLWIGVRSFRWWRLRRVAANILANTRSEVLRECGVQGQVRRADRAWSTAVVMDPEGPAWPRPMTGSSQGTCSASDELAELMTQARRADVISPADAALLGRLAVAADQAGVSRSGRGTAGLMANQVSASVAAELGVSAVTVRRRSRRALEALRSAVREGRLAA